MKTALRLGLVGLLLTLLALLALGVGLWFWSGHHSSLATALAQAARLLPAGQTLTTREVTGNLHSGGRIGWLRWQSGSLSIEAHDVQIAWVAAALLDQELRVTQVSARQLRIEDTRPTLPDAAPTQPPLQLGLPFKVNAHMRFDTVVWVGSSNQQLERLTFDYVFDSYQHTLDKGYTTILSNNYAFSGKLQAQAPMALSVNASGTVHTVLAGSTQPLTVQANAQLDGQLAGRDAQLALQATLTPHIAHQAAQHDAKAAMQMHLTAQLAPWQPQKIVTAQSQWQALNLATLWPHMPQTLLGGTGLVRPASGGWQADIALTNSLTGPLNEQRLPLQSLHAGLTYAQGQWQLQSLQANLAGGNITGKGQLSGNPDKLATAQWQAQALVKGINPAALDSRLTTAAIAGTLSTNQTSAGLAFKVDLQSVTDKQPRTATSPGAPAAAAAIRLMAQGVWAAPQLQLNSLQLDAPEASVQGQLGYNSASQATQGQLSLKLPGLQATAQGQLASTQGQGELTAQLSDAARLSRWLARWPVLGRVLDGHTLQGDAKLTAQWQGGWQNNGQAMHIKASLSAAQLNWANPLRQTALHGRQIQLNLAGTPNDFQLASHGTVDAGGSPLGWQTALQGSHAPDGSWRASISQLQLTLREAAASEPWQLWLGRDGNPANTSPLQLTWQQTRTKASITVAAGSASLQGPLAGTASLRWEPAQWSQPVGSSGPGVPPASAQWRSRGSIADLPLAWLDTVGQHKLAGLGISSNLQLSGHWDAAHTDSLHLLATLERSSGDARVTTDASGQRSVPANLSELRLQANLDGEQLSGSLRWNSERAGRALAAVSTQLEKTPEGWRLPVNAPLGGSLQMQLPPVDAWSMLAPPGWRLRGTMDADVVLSGTLAQPNWAGRLQAHDLAVRSAVDGIDFSHGSLLARLHGQQLDIENFSLQGAGGITTPGTLPANQSNQVVVTGSLVWLTDKPQASLAERLRLQLVAQARALRLSARPDRRMTVSGQLTAHLQDARFVLQGALKADSALLTLPEATPQLDDDVVIRKPAARPTAAIASANASAGQPARAAQPKPFAGGLRPELQIELDLGSDFQVRGQGVVTRLAGKLKLAAQDLAAPSLNGVVRTATGTYQAYGQRLQIERGLLRFTGAPDNPALTILAIRPNLSQRVGVQISGTALSPIVQLYADPDLPEAEKLGWLLLGRAPGGGGAEAALLQQAALALLDSNGRSLSGDVAQALGLDELSFSAGGNTSSTDGSTDSASITLGKRLSKDFYISYENSLNGAMGVIHVFYDLSRRLTLRAQTGEQSAIDLIYTLRYD